MSKANTYECGEPGTITVVATGPGGSPSGEFELPMSEESIAEMLGLPEDSDICVTEAYCEDASLPKGLDIYELNDLAERVEDLQGWQRESIPVLAQEAFNQLGDVLDALEDGLVQFFSGLDTAEDVWRCILEEDPDYNAIPEGMKDYFDFERYARDMGKGGSKVYMVPRGMVLVRDC